MILSGEKIESIKSQQTAMDHIDQTSTRICHGVLQKDTFKCLHAVQNNTVFICYNLNLDKQRRRDHDMYLCSCKKYTNSTKQSCKCTSTISTIENLTCSYKTDKDSDSVLKSIIVVGVLLPYTLGRAPWSSYRSANHYASAMYIALDTIFKDKSLLTRHEIKVVWKDTQCNGDNIEYLMNELVDMYRVKAFIGGDCFRCVQMAEYSNELKIPFISHICKERELTDKELYPMFARTVLGGNALMPSLEEVLVYYKWKSIGMLVETHYLYEGASDDITDSLLADGFSITRKLYIPALISFRSKEYQAVKDKVEIISKVSRVILLFMDIPLAKEALIAASELGLTNGEYVFLIIEKELETGLMSQRNPWKWAVADFGDSHQLFLDRSAELCRGLSVALLLMPHIPSHMMSTPRRKLEKFYTEVRTGMFRIFGERVYNGTIPGTNYSLADVQPPEFAVFLFNAFTVYAQALNKTLTEGKNVIVGGEVMENIRGMQYKNIDGMNEVIDNSGEPLLPLTLHRYGEKTLSLKDCEKINTETRKWPKMEVIGNLVWSEKKTKYDQNSKHNNSGFVYVPVKKGTISWPGNSPFPPPDTPKCGYQGNLCVPQHFHYEVISIVIWVGLVSVICTAVIYIKMRVRSKIRRRLTRITSDDLEEAMLETSVNSSE